jgi:PIN domain nuclease of toxin-antitoxin system
LILLDTHVVIWLSFDDPRLSAKARSALVEARKKSDSLAVSDITLFELAMLIDKGRIRVDAGADSFLQELESRFVVLPINAKTAVHAMALPKSYPKDPIDRIIGATALVHGLSLITADDAIRRSKAVATIW